MRELIVASPHGFCSGVCRAIKIAEDLLTSGETVYCLHELVHNRQVVGDLAERGMRFVGGVEEVPPGATLLFSAHGVPPSVRQAAEKRNLRVVDATCPFVERVHDFVRSKAREGYTIFLIGNRKHDEIIGIAGEAPESVRVIETVSEAANAEANSPVAVACQTTLIPDEAEKLIEVLKRKFPNLVQPAKGSICYATRDRQQAVRDLAGKADALIVLGSANSSNTNRLVEVAREAGLEAMLVENIEDLRNCREFRDSCRRLAITAGASTPQRVINAAIKLIENE